MTDKQFVHLHVHADASTLDGLATVKGLAEAAAQLGQPALALTDHGSMAATYDLSKACKEHGIKPIFGIEAYVAPDVPRTHKAAVKWNEGGEDDVSGAGAFTHMTMLAVNDEGLHNLMRASSYAYLDGFYRRPRIDIELLERYGRGVIATTGCPSGEVQTWLRIGDYDKALASAAKFRDLFEPGNYYVEVMDHGLEIENRVRKDLMRLAKDLKLPFIATNDLHYIRKTDASVHDALLCVGSGSQIADVNRFRFDSDGFYLKTAAEMRALWDTEIPEACDNTLLIAERCEAAFHEGANYMPEFPVPEGETEASWLEKEVQAGLERRFPGGVPQDRLDQAAYEVGVINQMGFPGYFLVTADFINWAKGRGIRVGPGRGSAAGSIVAYALGITDLDPIRHGLLFERFLNPERVSMPDIDVDFDERYRGEVIQYVVNKYGEDKVANISTSMMMKAKAAIKDATRVLGYPYGLGDRINKTYPKPVVGRDLSLAGAFDPANERFDEAGEFRALVQSDPDVAEVVNLARGLEGAKRGFGMHAAGVIMSREPLMDHVPLMKKDNNPGTPVMTAFEYPTCEKLGLLKMDFLGLSNLATISETLRQVKLNRGIDIDLDAVSEALDDPATYRLVAAGDTLGVFQLDSGPIRSLLRLMAPDCFEDISAVLALYRPGPMGANAHIDYADRKNGRKKVVPIHPELQEPLADILGETWGVIVYQEQVMAIAQKVAGYSLGKADLLRRAMGKKSKTILAEEFAGFSAGMRDNGYSDECIRTLWDILVPFADYAFNRAHSAGYGLVSYWTAYLKANFPAEYMAALLTTNSDDKDKTAIYLAECRRMGIDVLSPDVNLSDASYTATGDAIRFGLAAIKNVGAAAVGSWLETRAEKGPATSFADFLFKAETAMCGKRPVESLIKAGAFDSFGYTRRALTAVHIEAVEMARAVKKNAAKNQDSLFGNDADMFSVDVPDLDEWESRVVLGFEREMLGLYVSGHPLADLAEAIEEWAEVSIADVKQGSGAGGFVKIAGLVTNLDRKVTKKGDAWAILTIEDLDDSIQVYCFPRTYQQARDVLATDAVLIVSGRPEAREDGTVTLAASQMSAPNLATAKRSDPQLWKDRQAAQHAKAEDAPSGSIRVSDAPPLVVTVEEADLTVSAVAAFKAALTEHRGSRRVRLSVHKLDGSVVEMALSDEFTVAGSASLAAAVRAVFGPDAL